MTASSVASLVIAWLKIAIQIAILVSLAVILLKSFGFVVPIKGIDHVALAYLAGAYWLIK